MENTTNCPSALIKESKEITFCVENLTKSQYCINIKTKIYYTSQSKNIIRNTFLPAARHD
jgi:hypothetical protein